MNTVLLNTVNLDDGRIIKKGGSGGGGNTPGGGGVTIKNQTKSVTIAENGNTVVGYDSGYTGLEKVSVKVAIPNEEKTVEITENGTTEVVADSGFLSKVIVNTNVASGGGGGGGGGSDTPVIGDGKTYLYIKIAAKGRMNVPLYFSQTVANGVIIDWGDGSATQTLSGTGNVNTTHTYTSIGDYVIILKVNSGTLGLGHGSSSYGVMGSTGYNGRVYCSMLQAIEIGKNVTSIGSYTFSECYSLASVVIPDSVTSIGNSAFNNCYTLTRVVIPDSVERIGNRAFFNCYSLANVVIPQGTTIIETNAFYNCYGMAFYDFRASKSVPVLGSPSVFNSLPSDCKIVVPDALYDEWIAATNWSSYASYIIKASEFNA